MENGVVTGNSLLDRHVFSVAIVHVARGEAREEEMPGQFSILGRTNSHTHTHTIQSRSTQILS